MSSDALAPNVSEKSSEPFNQWSVLNPYLIAIAAQFPMLLLYVWEIRKQPHYKPILIAIIATIGIACMRWPYRHSKPFHQSLTSDVLMIIGLFTALFGALFVEPWFSALSVMLLVTSLLARTLDRESLGTLWPCSLPLFVYLSLPMGMDVNLITTLQRYSAEYTSRLLDLAGLGHHMDGTVINVPSLKEYGIEQACSGVQSFFTLLFVAVVFVVLSRRIKTPHIGVGILSMLMGVLLLVARLFPFISEWVGQLLLFFAAGFFLYPFIGFRASALILSAVFWAVFMNTIRILTIPLADYFLDLELSDGIGHTALGYFALTLGIVMVMSTDQFLLFLFGPVEESSDSGPFGRLIGRLWNSLSSTDQDQDSGRRRRSERVPLSQGPHYFLWSVMGILLVTGVWQLVDVQRSIARADKGVRFFDDDPTVEFSEEDLPEAINTWKRDKYLMQNRKRGSDLGQRSDLWQFRTPGGIKAIASLDQPFPGWHELTTCYKNTGWELIERKPLEPAQAIQGEVETSMEVPGPEDWGLVEAEFKKTTGRRGYLLFSHFDSFGEGLEVPPDWATFRSLFTRATNRLSHRIRARLLKGEAYQVQIFVATIDELDEPTKQEIRQKFLVIREQIRQRFLEKLAAEQE